MTTSVLSIRNIQEGFYPITMNTAIGHAYFGDGCCRRCSGKACEGHYAEYGKQATYHHDNGNVLNEAKVRCRDILKLGKLENKRNLKFLRGHKNLNRSGLDPREIKT